jgi:hypothetical protein
LKITGTGDMAQVVEHLPSKHEALSSNPSIAKEEKENNHWAIYKIILRIDIVQHGAMHL